jgi:hypothetical protein
MVNGKVRLIQSVRVNIKEHEQAPDRWDRRDCPVVERKAKPDSWLAGGQAIA